MAVITSYDTLQTAVADYCARSDLATFTPNFVQNWEEGFYRQPLNWGPWMQRWIDTLCVFVCVCVAPHDTMISGLTLDYLLLDNH